MTCFFIKIMDDFFMILHLKTHVYTAVLFLLQMNNINKASLLAVNNLGDSLLNQTKPGEASNSFEHVGFYPCCSEAYYRQDSRNPSLHA